ncbi:restriction endonuclease subunit S [Treponema sp.]|uniref:restriction endonuclease subunit S n=1 Tax=Treponema sp. TaxID=166 RepID=UPI00257F6746|nr:restriction endonuclease subunit S [Treponema sp.]
MELKEYRIKEIGKVVTGKTPSTFDSENYGSDYLFITPAELHDGYKIVDAEKRISVKGFNSIKSNTISGNSVLVGCIGWDMGNVGYTEETCATNQQINSICEFKSFCNPLYAYYWLSTKKKYLFSIASVTRTPLLSKSSFSEVFIPLPNREYQDEVVKILSTINNKIQINKKIIAELESMAKEIYGYWFIQFDFPNMNGTPYKASGGKMVWNKELGREIPDGWKVQKLTDYLVESTKSKIQVNQVNDSVGNVPFFTSGNAIHYVNDYLVDDLNIFLSTGGNASVQIYFGKASYSTDTWCINFSEYTSYMFIFIQSIIGYINDNLFTGSGLKHLQKDKFGDIKIAIPPENVINAFNKTVVNLFKMKAANMKSSRILNEQMNELLPLLMNGQVSVKE